MQLHFRKYGAGPPLIILHGLFGSSDNWHTLANRWGNSFTVYALDQRNHGSSPHESAMDYGEMAQDLSQFMDQQQIDSCYIVGHSMGGKVALLFASLYPERVSGLAVLDIGISRVSGKHTDIIKALERVNPGDYSDRRAIEFELEKYIDYAAIRQFLMKNILRRIDNTFSWKFNHTALLDHYTELTAALDLQESYLGSILFLRGAQSSYLEPALDPHILQYFPLAQITTIEKAGHWLHAEQPELIFTEIRDFFRED